MSDVYLAAAGAAFADLAARKIETVLDGLKRSRGAATIGLAGGNTPRPIYEQLAARTAQRADAAWEGVSFYFGDERAVPYDHPDSNLRMAREALFCRLPEVTSLHVHPLPVQANERPPRNYLPERLDLLLVGMGEDGHILSLFPGSPLLAASFDEIGLVAWAEAPAEPRRRMTLTPPALGLCHDIFVLVSGERKADVVARVLTGAPDALDLPAALVRDRTWILDEPAARRLPPALLATATRSMEVPP
jgi:6-phosphogluconolactonase